MQTGRAQILSYRPAAYIKVTGEDALSFLQGQFTNELRQEIGRVTYGLWLNQKGRVLADSYVLRQAGKEFIIVSVTSPAAVIVRRLEEYVVADDVTLTDATAGIFGLAVWGSGCSERASGLLGTIPGAGQFSGGDRVSIFAGRRTKGMNYEIVGPEKPIGEIREIFLRGGVAVADAGEAERARLLDGIPVVPQDIGPGDLPNEGGLEDAAISYTKGCYLGQEVMARLRNKGQIRRRLRVVRGPGAAPEAKAPLYQENRKAGEIRSAAKTDDGFIGLAMVTKLGVDENAGFGSAPDGPVTMRAEPA